MQSKIIGILLIIISLFSVYTYINKLNNQLKDNSIIILKLKEDKELLLKNIEINNKVFEDFKTETSKNISILKELNIKLNEEEKATEKEIKEVLKIEYKTKKKEDLKDIVNNQYNNIFGELNDL